MLPACEVMGCEQRTCLVVERERERERERESKVDITLLCVQLIYCSAFWGGTFEAKLTRPDQLHRHG